MHSEECAYVPLSDESLDNSLGSETGRAQTGISSPRPLKAREEENTSKRNDRRGEAGKI